MAKKESHLIQFPLFTRIDDESKQLQNLWPACDIISIRRKCFAYGTHNRLLFQVVIVLACFKPLHSRLRRGSHLCFYTLPVVKKCICVKKDTETEIDWTYFSNTCFHQYLR